MAVRGESVYAGCQDGYVKVLDLETRTLVRTIIVQEVGAFILSRILLIELFVEHRRAFFINAGY